MEKTDKKEMLLTVSTILKYLGAALVILIGAHSQPHILRFLLCGLAEECIVFALGEIILKKNRFFGWLISSFLLVVIFAQYAVLKLGGSFTSVIMVTNLHSVQALGGNSRTYLAAVVAAVIDFLLPVRSLFRKYRWDLSGLLAGVLVDALLCFQVGIGFSPVLSMGRLGVQLYQRAQMEKKIASISTDGGSSADDTLKQAVDNGYKYPVSDKMPNVVLIFTEGLSQSIVEDSRNIMPNVRAWEDKSLDFTNYFNHTAATYRGISGQLHSGYQFNDLDRNGLPSLQSVLKSAGYETTFINPEPNVADFTGFLKDLGFDHFVNGDETKSYVFDTKIYEMMTEQLEKADTSKPQFMAMYTFGTHVSQDSHDLKFGDGSNAELNKFYNDDAQFGKFMDKLANTSLGDNTLVVFTADHCTAKDADFDSTFGSVYQRTAYFCDRVPLLFWYKGITPQKIDVGGRNTLDMAPTVLDYLNIGQPESFLGTSLFSKPDAAQLKVETTFNTPGEEYYSTKGGKLVELQEDEKRVLDQEVMDYAGKATAAFEEKEKNKK